MSSPCHPWRVLFDSISPFFLYFSFLSFSVYFLHNELFLELDNPIVMASLRFKETWFAMERRPGWASWGAPEFVERHVISTWGAYFLVLRWVPRGPERGVSDQTGIGIPTAEFFLPSQFVLSSGELGVGRPCCAAQADRDLSETPPRHGRWSTTGEHECGRVGSVGQASRMVFP